MVEQKSENVKNLRNLKEVIKNKEKKEIYNLEDSKLKIYIYNMKMIENIFFKKN